MLSKNNSVFVSYLLSCIGVRFGLSHERKNTDQEYMRTGCWGKYLDLRRVKWWEAGEDLYNDELHKFYASPNIIRVLKSRRVRWEGQAARIGDMRNAYNIMVRKPKGRVHLEDIGIDGKIMLVWILGK